MKELLSKEHSSYKIHTLLMKSTSLPPPPPPPPHLSIDNLQENLDPPFYDFSKIPIPTPLKIKGIHTMIYMFPSCKIYFIRQ